MHPHAVEGAALIVIALMLGIIIGLVAFLARAVVGRDQQWQSRSWRPASS